MYQIQTNMSGTRQMIIKESHLQTIEQYALFRDLIDSNGIVDENVLEKLRLNVLSLVESQEQHAELLVLCQEVLFHDRMKAYGLHQLITLYINWQQTKDEVQLALTQED